MPQSLQLSFGLSAPSNHRTAKAIGARVAIMVRSGGLHGTNQRLKLLLLIEDVLSVNKSLAMREAAVEFRDQLLRQDFKLAMKTRYALLPTNDVFKDLLLHLEEAERKPQTK